MFFIFVLSHPQRNGDFFRYRCKTDVRVPDVTRTLDHVQQSRSFLLCVSIDDREKTLSQMLLADFYLCLG